MVNKKLDLPELQGEPEVAIINGSLPVLTTTTRFHHRHRYHFDVFTTNGHSLFQEISAEKCRLACAEVHVFE